MPLVTRRSVLFGLLAAPIVVRTGLLMPVKALRVPGMELVVTDGLGRVRQTFPYTEKWQLVSAAAPDKAGADGWFEASWKLTSMNTPIWKMPIRAGEHAQAWIQMPKSDTILVDDVTLVSPPGLGFTGI